ncbi:MAG: hypothetical protein GVY24_07095 [Planctomycetes bacterium]|jgi:hypothetical protein|nr:hypothetical protein [Planctomycetota bacterium]
MHFKLLVFNLIISYAVMTCMSVHAESSIANRQQVDLLADVNIDEATEKGTWVVRDDGSVVNRAANMHRSGPRIAFDADLLGSYVAEFSVERFQGNEALIISLPVGDKKIRLALDATSGSNKSIHYLHNTELPGEFVNGKSYDVSVSVVIKDGQAEITAQLNDIKLVQQCAIDDLPDDNWASPLPGAISFSVVDSRYRISRLVASRSTTGGMANGLVLQFPASVEDMRESQGRLTEFQSARLAVFALDEFARIDAITAASLIRERLPVPKDDADTSQVTDIDETLRDAMNALERLDRLEGQTIPLPSEEAYAEYIEARTLAGRNLSESRQTLLDVAYASINEGSNAEPVRDAELPLAAASGLESWAPVLSACSLATSSLEKLVDQTRNKQAATTEELQGCTAGILTAMKVNREPDHPEGKAVASKLQALLLAAQSDLRVLGKASDMKDSVISGEALGRLKSGLKEIRECELQVNVLRVRHGKSSDE